MATVNCQVPMDDDEAREREAGEDWIDQEGNPCPGTKYQAPKAKPRKVKKGTIDYAKYEARRRNLIAMLKAACFQEVLHLVTVAPKTDPYEAAKRIYGWTQDHFEAAMEDGFLIPLSPGEDDEEEHLGEAEIRALYIQAAEEVLSDVP